MEDIFEGFFRFFIRIAKTLVIELFFEFIIYYLGFGFLKLITFGRYPKRGENSETICVITGILVSVAVTLVIVLTNSSS